MLNAFTVFDNWTLRTILMHCNIQGMHAPANWADPLAVLGPMKSMAPSLQCSTLVRAAQRPRAGHPQTPTPRRGATLALRTALCTRRIS